MIRIKRFSLLITLASSLSSAPSFSQDQSEAAIEARITPISDVYINGEIETLSVANNSNEPVEPRSGEKVYNTYCIACHGTGAVGAPIKGDAAAWKPRIAQGKESLVKHAIAGFNAMPARGTCANCSDDEIVATVNFLTQGL